MGLSLAGTSTSEITVERLSGQLREVYVAELLGERRAQYESFFSHSSFDYETEANRFRQDGYFNSELGDTMPLALATTLQFPLIIFSSHSNTPVMYVTPDLVTTEATAFVVHTRSGLGHYDAATPCHNLSQKQSNQDTLIRCSCGVNTKDSVNQSCIDNAVYMTRCKCYKNSKPCTSLCRCVNYSNPSGARIQHSEGTRTRTKRKHHFQVDLPQSKQFAQERGETISEAIWSEFETIVLYEVCQTVEDMDAVVKLYNDVVYYSGTSYCVERLPQSIVFRQKRGAQIIGKRRSELYLQ